MTAEIEYLNEILIKERDELKDEIKTLKLDIEKKNTAMSKFVDQFCIINMPFGLPNDTKMIQVMVTKEIFEKEIIPYNEALKMLLNAKEKEAPTQETQETQKEIKI